MVQYIHVQLFIIFYFLSSVISTFAFQLQPQHNILCISPYQNKHVSGSLLFSSSESQSTATEKKDNKAMAFLKKIGKVGGEANKDLRFAIGVDEGPSGKSSGNGMKDLKKSAHAFQSCADTGILDDMTEEFPTTSSGTRWHGFTDRVMGGISNGNLVREECAGRKANVLRGKVSLANNGGFIQMATNLLNNDKGVNSVDVSRFEGIEMDIYNGRECDTGSEKFNVHLKTIACTRPFSSYRASFDAPFGEWRTIRIPFSKFEAYGLGAADLPFDRSILTRVGIVAIGKEMSVKLALSGIRFY